MLFSRLQNFQKTQKYNRLSKKRCLQKQISKRNSLEHHHGI